MTLRRVRSGPGRIPGELGRLGPVIELKQIERWNITGRVEKPASGFEIVALGLPYATLSAAQSGERLGISLVLLAIPGMGRAIDLLAKARHGAA